MKIKINSKALESALALLCAVNTKANMPILENVKIECVQGTCKLTTSSTDISVTTTIQASSFDSDGVIITNAMLLYKAVKGMAKQDLALELNEDTLDLVVIHSFGTISLDARETNQKSTFPTTKALENPIVNIVDFPIFAKHVRQASIAVAHDEVRKVMTGVYYEAIPEQGIITSATDGRKMVSVKYTTCANQEDSFIIPPVLFKLLDKCKGKTAKISHEGEVATISLDNNTIIHFRTLPGIYPNYRSIIPKKNPFKMGIRKDVLSASISRVGNFCNSASTFMALIVKNNTLEVFGKDNELLYSAKETLSMEEWNGGDFSIGVSWTYFKDLVALVSKECVNITFADPTRPILILEDNEDTSLTALLMPMKLDKNELSLPTDEKPTKPTEEVEENLSEEDTEQNVEDDEGDVVDTEEEVEDAEEEVTKSEDLPF